MTWKIPCLFLCLAVLLSGATAFGESRTIPYPEGIDPSLSGASSYGNIGDIADSPYFKHPDFYDMESTDTLTILPHFRTYQQSTEFTCGPGAVLMVLDYFGETGYDETEITEMAGCLSGQGSTPAGLLSFFEQIGWDATARASSPTRRSPRGSKKTSMRARRSSSTGSTGPATSRSSSATTRWAPSTSATMC